MLTQHTESLQVGLGLFPDFFEQGLDVRLKNSVATIILLVVLLPMASQQNVAHKCCTCVPLL